MVRRKIIRLVMCAAAIALLPALAGCSGWTYVPSHRQVVYYDYYYYPDVMVYYHINTGYYYYYSNGNWRRTQQRPGFVHLNDSRRQTVVIRDEHPYVQHASHRKLYPPRANPQGQARNPVTKPNQTTNNGVGHGSVQPPLPPRNSGAVTSRMQTGNQGGGLARNQTQPQIPPIIQPAARPKPQSTGSTKAKPVQPCGQFGKGKGKKGNTCG